VDRFYCIFDSINWYLLTMFITLLALEAWTSNMLSKA
jgi:hypothetical protein